MNIELLNRWGGQFLNFAWPMLWQSSALIAVIFILDLALRRKVRPAIRHALWLVVLVKLMLPPSLALPTGPSWWIHSPASPPAKAPPVSFTVTYGEQTMPEFPLPPVPAVPPELPALTFAAWAMILSGVASAGLLAWLLIRWRVVLRKIKDASGTNEFDGLLKDSARLAGWWSAVRLKLTDDAMSPAVCGLFRPVILLPRSLVEKLSAEQLRAVLLHELIHLRRGDVWVNCAQALLQIVYWWHPLLWLANARIRRVREEAVDDAVMLALRDDAEVYAPTLLEVAKFAFRRPLASLGLVGILESHSALRQRIERLMDFDAPRKAGLTIVSVLGILAFSAVALPMGEAPQKTIPSSSSNAQSQSPPNPDHFALDAVDIKLIPTTSLTANQEATTNAVDSKIQADKLVQDGKLLYEKGDNHEAETNFSQALKLDPDNQRAFYYLSLVRQVIYAREEHNGTNSVADSGVPVSNAGSPKVGFGLPVPNPFATTNVRTSPGREAIYKKLNDIRIESVSWGDSVPLSEAILFLAEQSKLRDPERTGINFIFNPNVGESNNAAGLDVSNIHVKLIIRQNVSLHDVLDAITMIADHPIKYSVEDYAVVISPKPAELEILEMRAFKIDPNIFVASMRDKITGNPYLVFTPGWQTNSVPTMAKRFFTAIGVNLNAPGRSIAYKDKMGLLLVRATPSELDTVERVIQVLNQVPPQIHIKARFIEVPKKGFVTPQLLTNAAAGQMTGILSAPEFRTMLQALERQKGVETLAEPECATTSGRRTMMRATDIQMILTNFALRETLTNSSSIASQMENGRIGSVVPQISAFEIGPTLDIVPYVLSDGYTINLTAMPSVLEFLGYDKSTNTVHATNSTGGKVSWPVPRPSFRIRQGMANVNLWDGQTLVFGYDNMTNYFVEDGIRTQNESAFVRAAEKKNGTAGKELLVLITATIVDPAGNRVHADDELPFNPNTVPRQPKFPSPSR